MDEEKVDMQEEEQIQLSNTEIVKKIMDHKNKQLRPEVFADEASQFEWVQQQWDAELLVNTVLQMQEQEEEVPTQAITAAELTKAVEEEIKEIDEDSKYLEIMNAWNKIVQFGVRLIKPFLRDSVFM